MRQLKPHGSVHPDEARAKTESAGVSEADLSRYVRTDLGRLLLRAREEFVAAEGHFLDRDELDRELIERRGEAHADCGG